MFRKYIHFTFQKYLIIFGEYEVHISDHEIREQIQNTIIIYVLFLTHYELCYKASILFLRSIINNKKVHKMQYKYPEFKSF